MSFCWMRVTYTILLLLPRILAQSLPPLPSSTAFPTYVQPPLPSATAVRDPSSWTLSPDFVITDVPTTRVFHWNLTAVAAAPDGYPRKIYSVNGMFPGPLIEANEGDTIVVHVTNNLEIPASIHWHGMFQNGTQWQDGVPRVSQCPIHPAETYTYEFKTTGQYGTYWWHSHYANTLADGLVGGLIVHSPRDPLQRGRDFDVETVVIVQDWLDLQSQDIVDALHSLDGYHGTPAPPQGDAILINGLGRTNCSNPDIQDHSLPCVLPKPGEIPVPVNKRVRLRIINTASFAMYRISVDNHPYEIVEADDTAVYGPKGVHEAQVAIGQRLSIVIDTNQGKAGDAWWFRANLVTSCVIRGNVAQTGLAVLRYVDEHGRSPSDAQPVSQQWDDLQGDAAKCVDIDQELDLRPRYAVDAPTDILQTFSFSSHFGVFVDKQGDPIGSFGFNNVSFQAQVGNPLLYQLEGGHMLDDSLVANAVFNQLGGGDIIVNNLDPLISHPYHLHGKPFFLVARGEGELSAEYWKEIQEKTAKVKNPFRRDTLQIPGGSWAVLRLVTDLPGVWPLHCHIGWHLSEGKLAAIIYQPDKIRDFSQPAEWKGLCKLFDYRDIGPAKRGLHEALAASELEDEATLMKKQPNRTMTKFEADLVARPTRSRMLFAPFFRRIGPADR